MNADYLLSVKDPPSRHKPIDPINEILALPKALISPQEGTCTAHKDRYIVSLSFCLGEGNFGRKVLSDVSGPQLLALS